MAGESKKAIFVADTYALIAMLIGSDNYKPYQEAILFTTDFALLELYWYCLRTDNKTALVEKYSSLLLYPNLPCLEHAARLRFNHKKESLSYADCVGWALSQQLGVPFLTGDKAFRDKPGVAFVRA